MKPILYNLLKLLLRPRGLVLVITYILTLIFISSSLAMLFVDYTGSLLEILAYTCFGLAGVSLGYSVYTIVIYAPGIKKNFMGMIRSNPNLNMVLSDWGMRTLISAVISFVFGIANAALNAYLGISERSIWFGALAAYYIFLAIMRGGLLLGSRRRVRSDALLRAKNYRRCGIWLLILNAALSSSIAQMIFDDRGFSYKDWLIYAFAAYAFYKITMAIINAIRARSHDDLTLQGIRNINIVDGAVSILALQTALLHTFSVSGEVDISLFNTLTGSVVSLFSLGLSIFMIVKGNREIKEIKNAK